MERSINVALAADIVVVDWMLDKIEGEAGSKELRDVIKGIIGKGEGYMKVEAGYD